MSSFEATRRLLESYPTLKIVVTTLTDTLEKRALAREAGAIGWLVKKNLVEEIRGVIETLTTN